MHEAPDPLAGLPDIAPAADEIEWRPAHVVARDERLADLRRRVRASGDPLVADLAAEIGRALRVIGWLDEVDRAIGETVGWTMRKRRRR